MRWKLLCLCIISIALFITCEDRHPHNTIEYHEGEPCKNNDECETALVCRANVCRKVCQVNADCKTTEQHCIEGVCLQGKSTECGNGIREADEECDDGDLENGNGCSSICRIEQGYSCKEDSQGKSICKQCGNGIIEADEECDDENNVDGDGCNLMCKVEKGFYCKESKGHNSICETICGDGISAGKEECDDENTDNGDGCNNQCRIEPNFICGEDAKGHFICDCKENHYGPNCEQCPECKNNSICKTGINNTMGCGCLKNFGWEGKDCSICGTHWMGEDCDKCSNGWEGENCSVCNSHWMGENCERCASPWIGTNCDKMSQIEIGNLTWQSSNMTGLLGYDGSSLNCISNSDADSDFITKYGCLYTWNDAQKICPLGWHLPSKEEFENLLTIANSNNNLLKPNPAFLSLIANDNSWNCNYCDQANNATLFWALPAGYLIYEGHYGYFGRGAFFWAAEEFSYDNAYLLFLGDGEARIVYGYKDYGISVRCIKDID